MKWELTWSEAKRLADSLWNNNPPAFTVNFQEDQDCVWAKTIFDYVNQGWVIMERNVKSYDWSHVETDQLFAAQERAVERLLVMFLEVPDELKPQANFADARLWYTLNLFAKRSPRDAFAEIEEEMLAIQCGLQCISEGRRRYEANRIGKQMVELRMSRDPRFPNHSESNQYRKLLVALRSSLRELYLPHESESHRDEGKDEVIGETLVEPLNSLFDETIMAAIQRCITGEFEKLQESPLNPFIDELRKQTAKKRMPDGGVQSLEEAVEQKDGQQISLAEMLAAEDNTEQEICNGKVEDLICEIEAEDSQLGKIARTYFEADKRPTQSEVGEQLGVTDRTIRNDRQKIKVFLENKIQEKNQV